MWPKIKIIYLYNKDILEEDDDKIFAVFCLDTKNDKIRVFQFKLLPFTVYDDISQFGENIINLNSLTRIKFQLFSFVLSTVLWFFSYTTVLSGSFATKFNQWFK